MRTFDRLGTQSGEATQFGAGPVIVKRFLAGETENVDLVRYTGWRRRGHRFQGVCFSMRRNAWRSNSSNARIVRWAMTMSAIRHSYL